MWRNWSNTASGNPVHLLVPPTPGPHLIQYFKRDGRESLGTTEIMVTPAKASLAAVAEAPAGSEIEVTWSGPSYAEDYIGIGRVNAEGANRWENFVYVEAGSPVSLTVPSEPGAYEITYFMRQDRTPLASVAFTATDITARIIAPSEAEAGSTIEIGWAGPDYNDDYIGIGRIDASGADQWENLVYTATGNPTQLVVPAEPGDYLLTYFQRQDRTPLVQVPITVTAIGASLNAPTEAIAGSTIEVDWTGPNYNDDYIGIGPVDATGAEQAANRVETSKGNPVELVMPTEPGDYVITYFQRQDRTPLAQVPITLTAVTASLTAPTEAVVGDTIEIGWTGPDYNDDYIGIGPVGATGADRFGNRIETSKGNPVELVMPTEPGDYLITYFQRQDRTPLAQVPITLTAVTASLIAPTEAVAGDTVEIGWTGPDYNNDYIGIGLKNATGAKQWQASRATKHGNPATLRLPDTPGNYVVRYFMRQDRVSLAEAPLTLK